MQAFWRAWNVLQSVHGFAKDLMTTRRATSAAVALAVMAWPIGAAVVWADIIRLKDGEELNGKILRRTATAVVVQFEFGTMSFSPDEIVAVEA